MHRTTWDSFERWRGTGPSYARGLIAGATSDEYGSGVDRERGSSEQL